MRGPRMMWAIPCGKCWRADLILALFVWGATPAGDMVRAEDCHQPSFTVYSERSADDSLISFTYLKKTRK
nr:hypothetical protein [Marinicella sp. W31]MDC2875813.1 hypothetical protein [Marinicella sp. W31]